MLAFCLKHCCIYAQPDRTGCKAVVSLSFFSNVFPVPHSAFPSSPRSGVPLGAKAICGGGSWASAEEQQADNRQQLPGGTLCGSLLLCTLGEYRKNRDFFLRFSLFWSLYSVSERAWSADWSRKTESS